ncbi:MAG TPA: hypothetical protein VEI51_03590 [Methanomicrobiales archaeon]|nr:hypothetical protein [Methanomicrobiales archaeon]
MKLSLSVLAGMLLIVSVLFIGPVAAATTGTAAVTGNPKASVSITLNQTSIYLNLDASLAQPITNTSLGIVVSTNDPFFISVTDNSGRGAGDQGYMGNFTTVYQTTPLNTKLASALGLSGTTNGTTTVGTITPPITTVAQTLYTGGQKQGSQPLTTQLSQTVGYSDSVLPSSSVYRIDLQFTITAM